MSKRQLALAVNVTPDAITKFEDGSCSPSSQTASHIALALRFPADWFFRNDIEFVSDDKVSFRSRRSMSAATRHKALAMADIVAGSLSPYINKRFCLPPLQVPDLSMHSPEDAAKRLREEWRLGQDPIHSVVHLLESKGVEVYWLAEPVRTLDAWSFFQDNRAFIALNTHITDGAREQFDAAHELGHLVLHNAFSADLTKIADRDLEREADKFASCFLMPTEKFASMCPRLPMIDQYLNLKKVWRVSVGSMIYRARDVGILSEWHYQIAARELSTRGWRTGEPDPLPRQDSQVHRMVCELLKKKGETPLVLADATGLPLSELLELMPVAEAYTSAKSGKVHPLFPTKATPEPPRKTKENDDKTVQLRLA